MFGIIIILTLFLVLTIILIGLFLWKKDETQQFVQSHLKIKDQFSFLNNHHKFELTSKAGILYCNACTKLINRFWFGKALECKKCGIITHLLCPSRFKTKKQLKCKYTYQVKEVSFNPHQWVEGNIPLASVCSICHITCSSVYDLEGSKCIWCQTVVHINCKSKMDDVCNYGNLKKNIITPNEVKIVQTKTVVKAGGKQNKGGYTPEIKFSIQEHKQPFIVIINKKSGGQIGNQLLNSFYRYLNPIQVIDLIDEGLDRLKFFKGIKGLRIIVAGGDGTIGSIISYMRSNIQEWSDQNRNPAVAILPLGTGNDLSRCLGWGGTFKQLDCQGYLEMVRTQCQEIQLSRWIVTIIKENGVSESHIVYNYFGIGLDAKMCLDFHKLREKHPYLFQSSLSNKFIYGTLGTDHLIMGKKLNLGKLFNMFCDNQQIKLPDINITYWGGGSYNVWGSQEKDFDMMDISYSEGGFTDNSQNHHQRSYHQNFKNQSFSDELLEVMGMTNIVNLGQCQSGFSKPIKIAQSGNIEIEITSKVKFPVQVDGEPIELEGPLRMTLKYMDKAQVLAQNIPTSFKLQSKVQRIFEKAVQNDVISQKQSEYLLKEIQKSIFK